MQDTLLTALMDEYHIKPRNARIMGLWGMAKTYKEIASEMNMTREAVAGVVYRNRKDRTEKLPVYETSYRKIEAPVLTQKEKLDLALRGK